MFPFFTPLLVFSPATGNIELFHFSLFTFWHCPNPSAPLRSISSFSLDRKRSKKIKDKQMLRCLSAPRTFGVTESGNIACIRVVRGKVEDAKAWFAITPIALCSVLQLL
jgi:hypothetical protein